MVCNAQSVMRLLKSCPSPVHDLQDAPLENAIASGRCKLHLIGKGENVALVAYEIQGKEFVICALKSVKTNHELDLSVQSIADVTPLAKENNCSYIRFHTFRPGLVRKALDIGFLPSEFILRKAL